MHGIAVTFCKHASATITHLFYIHTLISRCRISVIYPQEGTDLHFLSRFYQCLHTLRSHIDDLARSQFFIILKSEINICMALKWQTVCAFLMSYNNRSTSHLISCCIDSVLGHQQHTQWSIHQILHITDTFRKAVLLTDQCCDQFCHIDRSIRHFLKMCLRSAIQVFQ